MPSQADLDLVAQYLAAQAPAGGTPPPPIPGGGMPTSFIQDDAHGTVATPSGVDAGNMPETYAGDPHNRIPANPAMNLMPLDLLGPAKTPEQPPPPPPPAPMPVAQKGRPVSVGDVDPDALQSSFIHDALGRAGLAQTVPSPQAPAAPPPRDELADAQAAANKQRDLMAALDLTTSGLDRAVGQKHDDWYRRQGDAAGQTVADYMQRRQVGNENEDRATKKALSDPSAPVAQPVQMLAMSYGWPPEKAKMLSASNFDLVKQVGDDKQAQARLITEMDKARLDRTSAEKVASGNNSTAIEVERMRAAAELEKERVAKAAAAKGLKPLDAAELDKQTGALKGAQADLNAAKRFANVSGLGWVGSDSAKFRQQRDADALDVAVGINPLARETLAAKTDGLADTYMPGGSDVHGPAMAKFVSNMQKIRSGLETRVDAFRKAGIDPSPLEGELAQVKQQEAQLNQLVKGKAGGGAPATGKVHVAHPKTGEQFYVSPEDVKHAKADGFQVVG